MKSLSAHLAETEHWEAAHEAFQATSEYHEAFAAFLDDAAPAAVSHLTEEHFQDSADYGDAFETWHEATMEPPE